jgi:hypothetical protein
MPLAIPLALNREIAAIAVGSATANARAGGSRVIEKIVRAVGDQHLRIEVRAVATGSGREAALGVEALDGRDRR